MTNSEYDIVIIGGGMTGASLACALRKMSARIAIVEAVSYESENQPSYDDRGLALSKASRRILEEIGLWHGISASACPIEHIHISDKGHFGFVRLHARDVGVDAFGHVVIARELGTEIGAMIDGSTNITLYSPCTANSIKQEDDNVSINIDMQGAVVTLTAKLLIIADGSNSSSRIDLGIKNNTKDYDQSAIVTNVTPEIQHKNTAYERFTKKGPLALLPLHGQRCKLVYAVSRSELEQTMEMSDREFLKLVENDFGKRLGSFKKLGSRKSYPLLLSEPEQQVKHRVVLLGNAAHTIHPNAAQGFNLCLRDIASLSGLIKECLRSNEDIGLEPVLESYLSSRQRDQQQVIRFTDELASLFYNDEGMKVFIRNLGMAVMDYLPPLKRELCMRAMGLSSGQGAAVNHY
jgi:2-octaprenyl-6-methoxyphenol hydroxylase